MSRRRTTKPPAPAPEQGVTLNLRNPDGRIKEWDTEATQCEAASRQDAEAANRLRLEAEQHARTAGEAAAEEMRLLAELDKARQVRDSHEKQRSEALAEAKKYADRAKFFEDKAADLRDSIVLIKQALSNGNGQVSAVPTAMDSALARMDAARAELPPNQRQEENPL